MSNKKQHKKKDSSKSLLNKQKQRKKPSMGIVIPLAIIAIVAVVCVIGLIVDHQNQHNDKDRETTQSIVTISRINGSLVEGKQYNVWFDVSCTETKGSIRIDATEGILMMVDNRDPTSKPVLVESIDLSTIKTHSFVWIVDNTDEARPGKVDVPFDNNIMLKTTSIFTWFENGTINLLNEDGYKIVTENDDSIN